MNKAILHTVLILAAFFNVMEGFTSGISGERPERTDTLFQFNRFGSYGLFVNGINTSLESGNYDLSGEYSYRNFDGYRVHSSDYAHHLDLNIATTPSLHSRFTITGAYSHGLVKSPGSLLKSEFEADPFQADPRSVSRDEKRMASRGRVDLGYSAGFGPDQNQKIEIMAYGKIESFLKSTREYKIVNRYGLGLDGRYSLTSLLFGHENTLSAGGSLFVQPERTEEYENFSGQKSDQLEQLKNEKTNNAGCFIADEFELVKKRLFLELRGDYFQSIYTLTEETLPARSDRKNYHSMTPSVSLDYKINPKAVVYASYSWTFRSPTDKELDSPDPSYLYNQDLVAQTSKTSRAGIRGRLEKKDSTALFSSFSYKAEVYFSRIGHEIVSYEIYGDEFYRNATTTNRFGFLADVSLEIIRNLVLEVKYTHSHFEYGQYTANSLEADSSGNIVPVYRDFAGKFEPGMPGNDLNTTLGYKHAAGKRWNFYGEAGYRYLGSMWTDDANSDQTGGCNLVNAEAGFDLKLGRFTVSASCGVNNIFNAVWVGSVTVNSANYRYYNAGTPRDLYGNINFTYVF